MGAQRKILGLAARVTDTTNDMLARGFTRDLRARNRAETTIKSYMAAIGNLRDHYPGNDVTDISPDELRDFFAAQVAAHSATAAAIRCRALQQFFRWAAAEELVLVTR